MRTLARNVSATAGPPISVNAVEQREWFNTFVRAEEITASEHVDVVRGECLLAREPPGVVDSLAHEIAHFLGPQIHQQGAPAAKHLLRRVTRLECLRDFHDDIAQQLAVRSDPPRWPNGVDLDRLQLAGD